MKKQRRLQEAWENIRWISRYIEENQEQWELGRMEREEERKEKIREWEKAGRMRKIELIREREKEKKKGITSEKVAPHWCWEEWRKNKTDKDNKTQISTENDEKSDNWPLYKINFSFREPLLNVADENGVLWEHVDDGVWPELNVEEQQEKSQLGQAQPNPEGGKVERQGLVTTASKSIPECGQAQIIAAVLSVECVENAVELAEQNAECGKNGEIEISSGCEEIKSISECGQAQTITIELSTDCEEVESEKFRQGLVTLARKAIQFEEKPEQVPKSVPECGQAQKIAAAPSV